MENKYRKKELYGKCFITMIVYSSTLYGSARPSCGPIHWRNLKSTTNVSRASYEQDRTVRHIDFQSVFLPVSGAARHNGHWRAVAAGLLRSCNERSSFLWKLTALYPLFPFSFSSPWPSPLKDRLNRSSWQPSSATSSSTRRTSPRHGLTRSTRSCAASIWYG